MVLKNDFLYACWKRRDEIGFRADKTFAEKYQFPAFAEQKIGFYGFQDDQLKDLEEALLENGGTLGKEGDEGLTHLVVPNAIKNGPKILLIFL